MPYLFIPIGLLALLLYGFSFLLVRLSLWQNAMHRKVWNILLLITFLTTAILGLLLVIQINYKLDWGSLEAILRWHVQFGIAMSFIAVFHLSWHWQYYLNLIRKKQAGHDKKIKPYSKVEFSNRQSLYLILLSGFIATVTQVLFMREIMTVFQGNELMMAWTLGIWMFLTGIGAFLGRRGSSLTTSRHLSDILFLTGILPIFLLPLLTVLKISLFPPGVLINPIFFLLIITLLLMPLCILSGINYAKLVHLFQKAKNDFIRVYAFEALGSLIGGICVTFIMIQFFSIPESFLVVAIVVNIALFLLRKKIFYAIISGLCTSLLVLFFVFPINEGLKSILFVNQHVIETRETHLGNITVTENAGQYDFYENGNLLFTSENVIVSEEYVHYAMLQHRNPRQILIVSGGISDLLKEVLKYPSILSIDYIELNPIILELESKFTPLPTDERIHMIDCDARRYLNGTKNNYDVAIIALPDPASLQINRFYTNGFIESLKKCLNPEGVVIVGISPSVNYMSESKLQLEAGIYNTLHQSFKNVRVIPGERDYFLASDSSLSIAIASLSERHSIQNEYVNTFYIDDLSVEQRSNAIVKRISGSKIINTDNKPLPVFYSTVHFLSQFGMKWWLILLVPLILLLLPFFYIKSQSQSIYLAGFTAASVEILLIFSFQLVFGNVYSAIGIIVAIFMSGLAIGALLGRNKKLTIKNMLLAQLLLVIYCLYFLVSWMVFGRIHSSALLWLQFIILTVIPSTLTGYIYVVGTKMTPLQNSQAATLNYSVDLWGSTLGVLIFSFFILPVTGIESGCLILAGINLLGILLNKPLKALQSV